MYNSYRPLLKCVASLMVMLGLQKLLFVGSKHVIHKHISYHVNCHVIIGTTEMMGSMLVMVILSDYCHLYFHCLDHSFT